MSSTTLARHIYDSKTNMFGGKPSPPCTTNAKHMCDSVVKIYENDVTTVHTGKKYESGGYGLIQNGHDVILQYVCETYG